MSRVEDGPLREALITEQPVLWVRAMLEEAESVRTPEAREAILARVGAVLYARFAVSIDKRRHPSAHGELTATTDDRAAVVSEKEAG